MKEIDIGFLFDFAVSMSLSEGIARGGSTFRDIIVKHIKAGKDTTTPLNITPHDISSIMSTFPRTAVRESARKCRGLGFRVTAERYEELEAIMDARANEKPSDHVFGEMVRLSSEVRRALRTESGGLRFLFMESDRVEYWENPLAGWDDILENLPNSAALDVEEASRCYACSRATACVMHLCRVLECAFKKWSKNKNVSLKHEYDRTSWEQLAEDIKAHRDKGKNSGTLTAAQITEMDSVRGQILILKDNIRNKATHATETFYTEEKAYEIYHLVRSLARDLVVQ